MLQPLEEQFQAQMGARLNPRQLPPEGNIFPTVDQLPPSTTPSDPWVPMMPFYGAQPQGSFSMMPQSWQPEIAALPEQEWTPYSAIFRSLGGKKLQDGEVVPGRSKWDIAEAAFDTTDFLPGGGPIGDILGFGGKMVGKGLATVPWGDVAKAIPEGTMAGLAGMFGSPSKKPKLSRQDLISQGYYKRDDTGKVRYPNISQGYGDLVDIDGREVATFLTPHEAADFIFDNLKQNPIEESWAGIPMQRQLRYIGDDNHTVIFNLSHDGKSLLVREGTHGQRANQLMQKNEIEEAGGALQWGRSDRGKEILKQRDEIAKAWIDHFLELPYVEKFRPEGTGGVLP